MSASVAGDRLDAAGFEAALSTAVQALCVDGAAPPEVVATAVDSGFTAFLLVALQRRLHRPIVVVVPDGRAATELVAALSTFDPPEPGGLAPAALVHPGDVTPFHEISASRQLVIDRITALLRLRLGLGLRYIVMPADALLRRVLAPAELEAMCEVVSAGSRVDRDGLLRVLAAGGYAASPAVEDPGTFAVRGGVVDIFSPLYDRPFRLDFFDDELESIRFFEPDTQRSAEFTDAAWITPAREIPLHPEARRRAEGRLGELAGRLSHPTSQLRGIIEDLRSGGIPHGAEAWLPAFAESTVLVADYVGPDAVWVLADQRRLQSRLEERHAAVVEQHGKAVQRGRLVFDVADHVVEPAQAWSRVAASRRLVLESLAVGAHEVLDLHPEGHAGLREALREKHGDDEALQPLVDRIRGWRAQGEAVVIACHTHGGAERMAGMLRSYGLTITVTQSFPAVDALRARRFAEVDAIAAVGEVGRGFRLASLGFAVVDEAEVLGHKARRRTGRRAAEVLPEAVISSFQELQPRDFVVHADYGVARYDGLVHLSIGGVAGDFLHLVFRDGQTLYLPVYNLHKVQRFLGGEGEAPPLDKLGGTAWEKAKARVRKELLAMAKQLVKLQAERQALRGFAYGAPGEYYREFEASFPYEETPDQQRAIDEVLVDLEREQPMDRLVCGDVGFGKTEVAIRAAFRAVEEGRQVAVLVPTTVLAEQHLCTFRARFDGYPIEVETLSRTKTGATMRQAVERLASGRIDVVVGTHRLLSKDVQFRNLGLVIVDEEHRFGVRHKEKLKELRRQAHVLTLTATPIPRTMHLALMGIRDLSVMRTPPTERLAVRTIVEKIADDIVVEAIEREIARGGQVFVIHNRVSSINRRAEYLGRLVPHARIAVAHGQMNEDDMTGAMRRFIDGDANVLVSTTIVESGIDIPNANTLLVERADRFGLAELYQLRGRVGRSDVRAYAYFLIPEPSNLSDVAARRIGVLQRFTELGSGFHIASQDLEIRGAGNILGAEQSGRIESIGFDLYFEMLEEALAELRGQPVERRVDTEVRVPVEAFIPEAYCPDTGLRLLFYKRMAQADSAEAVGQVLADLVDRCGKPPDAVRRLAELADLKLAASALGIDRVQLSAEALTVRFSPQAHVEPTALLAYLAQPGVPWRASRDGESLMRPIGSGPRALPEIGVDPTAPPPPADPAILHTARRALAELRPIVLSLPARSLRESRAGSSAS